MYSLTRDDMFPSPRGVELHKPEVKPVVYVVTAPKFPSPRGVELHKPGDAQASSASLTNTGFPSPRGVELHKPNLDYVAKQKEAVEFPSPRGVELHKPSRLPQRGGDNESPVSVPSRG